MLRSKFFWKSAALVSFLLGATAAQAAVVYNEAVSGDLSNVGTSPTLVNVSLGSNIVEGSTGRISGVVDLDYFTITIPAGLALSALVVEPGTQSAGPADLSFIGLQAGNQFTVPPTTTTAAGLLGWAHYSPSDIGTDILPRMATSGMGATDFTTPLPAGSYSFWIQELSPGAVNYVFDLEVTPEPGTWLMLAGGLALVLRKRLR